MRVDAGGRRAGGARRTAPRGSSRRSCSRASRDLPRYEVEVELGDARDARARPLLVPADARRARPAPGRRGQPPGAVGAPRRPPPRDRRRAGRRLHGLGAVGALGERGGRLERLGRARAPDAHARRRRASGSCSCRASAAGAAVQVRDPRRRRVAAPEGRPRGAAPPSTRRSTASEVFVSAPPLARTSDWMAARAASGARTPSRCRSTRSTWPRGAGTRSRATAPLSYVELGDELGDYAHDMGFTHVELLPVMAHPFPGSWGYQVTSYFAPVAAPGLARRPAGDDRPPPRARHRRDPRLGPRPLPARRVGARALRRHRALRARGPAPRRPPRLGHADLQLRPQRGAQLPASRARSTGCASTTPTACAWTPSRRCSTATTRARPASGCPTSTAAARTSRRSASCASSTRSPTPREPGDDHGRRGVDRLAGRLAPDRRRRPRLRLQVEHGLDARHARVLRARAGPPPLPPRRADLQPGLRVHRAVRAAALARRGRARQGVAAVEDARRRLAAATPTCGRSTAYMWAHPGKKLLFMGGELAQEQEWSHERSLDWHLLEQPRHAGVQRAGARPQPPLPRARRPSGSSTPSPAGFRWLVVDDRDANVVAFARFAARRAAPLVAAANLSPVPRTGYRLPMPRPGRWREVLNTRRRGLRRRRRRQHGRRRGRGAARGAARRASAEVTLPPLGVVWLTPDE